MGLVGLGVLWTRGTRRGVEGARGQRVSDERLRGELGLSLGKKELGEQRVS